MTSRLPPWLVFLLSFAALHTAWEGLRAGAPGRHWVEGMLVPASAQLVQWARPQWDVRAQGRKLRSPAGGLTVQRGCEGMEFIALGWAALLAAGLGAQARSGRAAATPGAPSAVDEGYRCEAPTPLGQRIRQSPLGHWAKAWLCVTVGVVALGVLRLATLMWCRVAYPDALALWHGMLTPVLMVLGTALLCAPWLRPRSPRQPRPA